MSAPLILRHCSENLNPPAPNQLVVGELVINSRTGKLYTRLALDASGTPGPVVEFVGAQVCYDKVPSITYDNVDNFCCQGDLLNVKVVDLIRSNDYTFEIIDISSNNVSFGSPYTINYTDYTVTGPGNSNVELKEATVSISTTIAGNKNLTILKFKVLLNNKELTSRTIAISCGSCGA